MRQDSDKVFRRTAAADREKVKFSANENVGHECSPGKSSSRNLTVRRTSWTVVQESPKGVAELPKPSQVMDSLQIPREVVRYVAAEGQSVQTGGLQGVCGGKLGKLAPVIALGTRNPRENSAKKELAVFP